MKCISMLVTIMTLNAPVHPKMIVLAPVVYIVVGYLPRKELLVRRERLEQLDLEEQEQQASREQRV